MLFGTLIIILSRQTLFLLSIALVSFGGCLWGSFHFDDYSLFSGSLWHPFPTRPLTYLTFWINGELSGRGPILYHAVNLALHLAAIALAFTALQRVLPTRPAFIAATPTQSIPPPLSVRVLPTRPAFIAAAIFAVHPFQAEPVNYIFARATLLETIFCLAALIAWTRGRRWWAVAWFAGALLAKEECVSFPIVLVLLEISTTRALREWKPIAAMLALALAAGLRVFLAASATTGSDAGGQAAIAWTSYLATQGAVILRYLRMLILPWGFTVDADVAISPLAPGLLAWVAIAALVALAALKFTRLRAGFWFIAGLVLLLPSSSIFPASDLAADRRLYLPMIGFAACAGLLLQRIRTTALLAAVVVLATLSFARTGIWRTEESLWSDAVAKAPDKIRPKLQLARAVGPPRAFELLQDAASIAPDDPRIASEQGRMYLSSGQPRQALIAFGRALALAPESADAVNNRGVALLAMGQLDAARQDFERALAVNPCQFDARLNLRRLGIVLPPPGRCGFSSGQLDSLGR